MSAPRKLALLALIVLTSACATAPARKPPPLVRVDGRSAGADALVLEASELIGTWVEFWALSGRADTQRYVFQSDGSFEWHAAPHEAAPGVTLRSGRYLLQSGLLVLDVEHEEPAQFAARAAQQRLPLGACPPDQEARAADATYRCLSFNGRAFWRR